jgi:hypothetical protein
MIRTALQLASRGLHVFPCWPRDKRPATAHGVKDATTDAKAIRSWWQHDPQFNIAIATGKVSSVFVVDIDGVDAELELRRLEAEHGELPATVEVITARGRHLYFKMPDMPLCNSAGKIAPGVDVRANDGYTLVPPSIHPSGRAYAWSVDSSNTFAAAPDWLLARIAGRSANGNGHITTAPSEWRALIADGIPEGRRDCTLARIAGYLLRHHIDPVFAAGLVQIFNTTRCLPPLPDEDVERIVNSIAGKELKRRQQPNG